MATIQFALLKGEYRIHRLPSTAEVPAAVFDGSFYAITRTDEELSIVTPEDVQVLNAKTVSGWTGIKVLGPLDFGLTGILAGISGVLADAGVSIFAVSTFDTDYILFKKNVADRAVAALTAAGHECKYR